MIKKILKVDYPNANGRIYPSAVVDRAIQAFNESLNLGCVKLGEFFGGNESPGEDISLSKISHKINILYRKHDIVYADIEILNTELGRFLRDYINSSIFRPRGKGSVRVDVNNFNQIIQCDYEIITIDCFPIESDTFFGAINDGPEMLQTLSFIRRAKRRLKLN